MSNKATLPSFSRSYTVSKYPSPSQFSAIVFAFLYFLLVIFLFNMAPQHGAKVLFSVPYVQEGCDVLYGEIRMLDDLHLGVSYSALGCESSVDNIY